MHPEIELRSGGGRAAWVDERWVLEADRDDLLEVSAAVQRQPGLGVRRWVVSDPTEADAEAAIAAGLTAQRDVLQLRRSLPVEAAIVADHPSVEVRPLRPGTEDEAAWVACNNRAFSGHPDQGSFTLDRLHHVMAEPWFDPQGFLLHGSGTELTGFCWTKVHDLQPPLGEIFVIGIDPSAAGRGLGGALTLAGLTWLADQGIGIGMLYVDGDNAPARRLYAKLGFTQHHTDRIYESA